MKQEVVAWAQGLVDGKPNPKQFPEEALVDLVRQFHGNILWTFSSVEMSNANEIFSQEILEKLLRSGEAGGEVQKLLL